MIDRTASALCLALLAATAAAQEPDYSKVEVVAEKVSGGVFMLKGAGGNIGLSVGPDGAFLVDDQYAPLTPKVTAAVAAVTDKPIRFVLNTHWHWDHTGGNENLGTAGTLIVAHDNVRRRMSTEQFVAAFNLKVPASPPKALPVVTFTDAVTFHWNGEEIHAFHVPPAHTDGDSVVHFRKADVLHLGDVFFNGMYPFVDLDTGGSVQGLVAAVERALAMAGETTRIIPGHGPLASRSDLVSYRDMLKGVLNAVGPLVSAGRTLEETKAAKPLAAYDAKWGGGFLKPDDFLGIVYRSLKAGAGSAR